MKPNTNTGAPDSSVAIIDDIASKSGGNVALFLDGLRMADEPGNDELGWELLGAVRKTGLQSSDRSERQLCVAFLVDKVVQEPGDQRDIGLRFLQEFRQPDFSEAVVSRLISLYRESVASTALIRVIGIAEITALKSELAVVASDPFDEPVVGTHEDRAWAASLAIARMGDGASAKRLVQRVQTEEDIVQRATTMFRDLAYTRHLTAIEALIQFMDSKLYMPAIKSSQLRGSGEAASAARVLGALFEGTPDLAALSEEEQVSSMKVWLAAHQQRTIR